MVHRLHEAIRGGSLNRVRAVLYGPEGLVHIDSREGGDGLTPLQLAARSGYVDIVRELVEKGANMNAPGGSNCTALHFAVNSGHLRVAMYLIICGADIEIQTSYGRTAMHLATVAGYIDIVRYLFLMDASMDAQDLQGRTPFHLAVEQGNRAMVELLIEACGKQGVNIIEIQDSTGQTPLHLAVERVDPMMVELLIQACGRRGVNIIETVDSAGKTPLHLAAAKSRDNGIVRYLLENHASSTARDNRGRTPLHSAVESGSLNTVQLLVRAGADIAAEDIFGVTLLQQAKNSNRTEMISYLSTFPHSSRAYSRERSPHVKHRAYNRK